MVYGYFCFRLSLARSRPAVGSAGRHAICLNRRCIGWRCRWGSPARGGLEASLTRDDANSSVGRNGCAAAGNCGRPCRVTVNGAGKTGVLVALAQKFLTQTAPFVFLSVDRLAGVAKLVDLKGELGLTQDLLDVLEAWPGGEPGVIIIDALNASRGGPSEAAFASLIELALPRLGRDGRSLRPPFSKLTSTEVSSALSTKCFRSKTGDEAADHPLDRRPSSRPGLVSLPSSRPPPRIPLAVPARITHADLAAIDVSRSWSCCSPRAASPTRSPSEPRNQVLLQSNALKQALQP